MARASARARTGWLGGMALALAALLPLAGAGHAAPVRDVNVPMASVSDLDLTRYAGLWYEMARFPSRFERNCAAVTAEYTLQPNGRVQVVNSCRQGGVDGPLRQAKGQAWVVAPGQLKVSFVPLVPLFAGDYWVLYVAPDYSLAVVGSPEGSYGWILSRTPQVSKATWAKAEAVLRANGYDLTTLERVAQP